MSDDDIQQMLDTAMEHHLAGRLGDAEPIYRQVIAEHPDQPDAYHRLGMLAHHRGNADEAVTLIDRAIRIDPDDWRYHCGRGEVLLAVKQYSDAIAAFERALRLNGDALEALVGLAVTLHQTHELDRAIAVYQRLLSINPNLAEVHNRLGSALQSAGRLSEAIAAYRQAVALQPVNVEALSKLGSALQAAGRLDEAIAACRAALTFRPDFVPLYNNLGNVLADHKRFEEAAAVLRQAVTLDPEFASGWHSLAKVLRERGEFDAALDACRNAVKVRPDFAEAYIMLGGTLRDLGRLNEALECFRTAVALNPDDIKSHSILVGTLQLMSEFDAPAILREAQRFDAIHARPLGVGLARYENNRDPDRRLRIGYVSPNFRVHIDMCFTIPLFTHHNREQFEIFCYADLRRPDTFTERIGALADCWRPITGRGDAAVADLIRADRIDILVDLTMHTDNGRPLVFARKPAPVQVAWLAYPGTTGLSAMDYRLTDPYLDPDSELDCHYSERSIRLPDTFWCYDPLLDDVVPSGLPALANNFVTFGCLNNFCKVSDETLALWGKALANVANSRLILLCPATSDRQRVVDKLGEHNVAPERIEFVARLPRRDYFDRYRRIDICLDTLPYNGHTTSLDSFWVGVPVVTRVGPTVVGRGGWSQLCNLGLPELAAHDDDEFADIVTNLANDLPRLADLRRTLRGRMKQSPLMDAPRFAKNIENAYRQMWTTWLTDKAR